MPTQQEIDKVKLNLSNLIDLNTDILINGNIKIENAFSLLTIKDDHDLGVQIGINLIDGAFWAAAAINGGPLAAAAANFCCGVISHYSDTKPLSLQGTTANLLNRLQVTSMQFQYDLQSFFDNPELYWDKEYCGTYTDVFGSRTICGKLSDLATVDVPSKEQKEYTEVLVKSVYGLDQVVWAELLKNFVITKYYPSEACYTKWGCTQQTMIDNANSFCSIHPSYYMSWDYEEAKGFWGGDKSAYWSNEINIGVGVSMFSDGHLSDQACNYLFLDLYNTPNPNVTVGGGLYTRDFVFNHMPNIKHTTHTYNY